MNLLLLLAMLQNATIDVKPAPEFRMVCSEVVVSPEKSKYFERTKVRILAMKQPYEHNEKAGKYFITSNFYWQYRVFYFKDTPIPLSSEEEWELRDLLILQNDVLKEKQRRKTLEQL